MLCKVLTWFIKKKRVIVSSLPKSFIMMTARWYRIMSHTFGIYFPLISRSSGNLSQSIV